MGEYWKPVNLTRGEFINPHRVGNGLKLGEWNHPGSHVRNVMAKHWQPTDDVRAVSDYGGEMQLSGRGDVDSPEWDTLEEKFVEIGFGEGGRSWCGDDDRVATTPTTRRYVNSKRNGELVRYIVRSLEFVLVTVGFVWLLNRCFEGMNQKDTFVALVSLLAAVALIVGGIVWLGHMLGKWGHTWYGNWRAPLVLVLLALWTSGCTRVGPGYVGIKVSMAGSNRGVEDAPMSTGWVFYNPLGSQVFEYPTFVQTAVWTRNVNEGNAINEEITFTNQDQMQVSADISLSYHLVGERVPAFYVKFRSDDLQAFTHGFLRNVARDAFNEHAGKYQISQIMGDNAAFIKDVRDALQTQLTPIGVQLDQFGFIGAPRPPQAVIDAINAKVHATQLAQQKQNELIQVQADANKTVAEAEGYARSMALKADADSSYNRKVAESLTPLLVQNRMITSWDGKLPQVTSGVTPFLNLKP